MRNEILQYTFFWNNQQDEGIFNLVFVNGSGGQLLADSASEAMLILDVLRNEKPVYYDDINSLLMTGMEPVGEGELPEGVTDINTLWDEQPEAETEVEPESS